MDDRKEDLKMPNDSQILRVDCHRHLGGCISPDFVWSAVVIHGQSYLAETYNDVLEAMTFGPDEPPSFHRFLDKFRILDTIKWTPELIELSIKQVAQDLIDTNVDYTWMRFTVNKYMPYLDGWHRHQVIKFVYDCFQKYAPGRVGLILSVKYESPRANQRQYLKLIEHPDVLACVLGIDLVGDEAYFDYDFYQPFYRDWQKAGKVLMAHLAESQDAINIVNAHKYMGVTDVCHGIKAVNDQYVLDYARDNQLYFHMALRSNYLTDSWPRHLEHPIVKCVRHGIKVTVGSDDPIQCDSTLDSEYYLAVELGLTADELALVQQTAVGRVVDYLNRE